jgi:hypothetical protein
VIWIRYPVEILGTPGEPDTRPADAVLARERVYKRYERFLAGMRANDIGTVLEVLHTGVASTIRDYVANTGTITDLKGIDSHRSYYEAFFDMYEVTAVEKLCQVTEDWYVFAELRFTMTRRDHPGFWSFHTAEFWAPAKTGQFIARIGHGTSPAPE